MKRVTDTLIAASLVFFGCACGGDTGPLRVGSEPDSNSGGSGGYQGPGPGPIGDGSVVNGNEALTVRVHNLDEMTVELITLACAGDCADVVAVARGGNPPYAFKWEDGSTNAARRVCLDASTTLTVTATDTAIDTEELAYEAQRASTDVTATVLDCTDAGVAPDGGADDSVYWATWTSMTLGAPGSAAGTFSPPGGTVDVTYTGEAVEPSAITGQPSTLPLIGVITFTPESTFTSNTVTNAPPPSGMISLAGDAMLTQTLTFSSPVRNPLIAVMSLGNFGVAATWDFDATPVVLSTGPGILGQDGTLTTSGNSLFGNEGNGVVELAGTFTSLSFTIPAPEQTAQFTIGIRGRE